MLIGLRTFYCNNDRFVTKLPFKMTVDLAVSCRSHAKVMIHNILIFFPG